MAMADSLERDQQMLKLKPALKLSLDFLEVMAMVPMEVIMEGMVDMEVMASAGSLEKDQQMLKQVPMQMPKQKLHLKLILVSLEGMAIAPMGDIMVAMEAMAVMAMADSLERDQQMLKLALKLNPDF